ncbi:MAG: hypothetical protein ACRC5M_03065 [Anaeroplasmataceae bacterium]
MKKIYLIITALVLTVLLASCSSKEKTLKIAVPSGAPVISQIMLEKYVDNIEDYKLDITYMNLDGLTSSFTSKSHDIIFAPTNLGAKLYNNNSNYLYTSTVTWGNNYLVTNTKDEFNLKYLKDKPLTLFGENTVNDYILKKILKDNDINYDSKNTIYKTSTIETQSEFILDPSKIYMISEPQLSIAIDNLKLNDVKIIDLQEEYKKVSNDYSYPQAGVFINSSLIESNKTLVDQYLKLLKQSTIFVNNEPKLAAQLTYGFDNKNIDAITKSIINCNIRFSYAKESREDFEELYKSALNYIGNKLPDEKFYAY